MPQKNTSPKSKPHVTRPVASLAQQITAKANNGRVPAGSAASELQSLADKPGGRNK